MLIILLNTCNLLGLNFVFNHKFAINSTTDCTEKTLKPLSSVLTHFVHFSVHVTTGSWAAPPASMRVR